MKIAVDCADLDCSRIDGTRVYIKNVLNFLGKIGSGERYFLYHQRDFNSLLKPSSLSSYTERKIPYSFWWTQTRFAYELLRDRPDVLWMPIQQIPFLVKNKIRTIVTIHDLAFKLFPQHFTKLDRFKLNLFTDAAVKKADKIIAVSFSTKKDILRFYPKLNEEKIKVVYHGYDQAFAQKFPQKAIKRVLAKYGITKANDCPPQYILYVGAIQPRKDLRTLVKAFEKIKQQPATDAKWKLVIVGEPAWKAEETLAIIKKSHFRKEIIMTGRVNFSDLIKLYQAASLFILPSLYEGFGMPILEAWASGVPVIVANNSSLAEIGGNAVLKFSTQNPSDLSEKVLKLLSQPKLKNELVSQGRQRLKKFSWEKCAKETLAIIKKTANYGYTRDIPSK
jgi:glycosyltransferase involved in cell wall biosynthesis